MTTSLTIDPTSPNAISNELNGISAPHTSTSNLGSGLQSMMQMQILSSVMRNLNFIRTGDPAVDMIITTIVQVLLISGITILMSQLASLGTGIKTGTNNLMWFAYVKSFTILDFTKRYILCMRTPKKILLNRDISNISENRQINELYKAVFWYLTNNKDIKYIHEPVIQYVFDKKITMENKDTIKKNLAINQILSQNNSKEITYKNLKITYVLSTELITIYTDKDRKRENQKIKLIAIVNACESTDVLYEFCQHCLAEYINNLSASVWEQMIYTNKAGEWTSTPSNNTRKMDTIILKKGLKDEIKKDNQIFNDSEAWYTERDIPYTRGYLFYGYPGTGKTSMIKGMSLNCKRHIHYLMLNEISSDSELFDLLKKINYKETILVIEDIDAMANIVKSREEAEDSDDAEAEDISMLSPEEKAAITAIREAKEKKKEKKEKKEKKALKKEQKEGGQQQRQASTLTLSGLLNAIDGVYTCHGRILIMTTNHPEVLDLALIRPGRIDSKYLFDNCDKEQIKDLYEMFFGKPADHTQLSKITGANYSPAHIASVFLLYRNRPEIALCNLDTIETKIKMLPSIKDKTMIKVLSDEVAEVTEINGMAEVTEINGVSKIDVIDTSDFVLSAPQLALPKKSGQTSDEFKKTMLINPTGNFAIITDKIAQFETTTIIEQPISNFTNAKLDNILAEVITKVNEDNDTQSGGSVKSHSDFIIVPESNESNIITPTN